MNGIWYSEKKVENSVIYLMTNISLAKNIRMGLLTR